jgi:cytochrome c biogenesis protein ResB
MMKDRIWKYCSTVLGLFKSVRFTALIIALLIGVYFLGLVIPQKWMFQTRKEYMLWVSEGRINRAFDFYGFTDIYLSPLTITLLVLFFITLLVITGRRVPLVLRKAFLTGEPPSFSSSEIKRSRDSTVLSISDESGKIMETIYAFFQKKKWHLMKGKEADTVLAVKNRFSPLGFLLFHFSFFLLLIGGLIITYTGFRGNLALTEGQAFHGDMTQFSRVTRTPKILKDIPTFEMHVEGIRPFYEGDVPVELTVDAHMKYKGVVKSEVLRINEPIKRGPLSILAKNIGISPLFIVRGGDGREIDGAYVSLNVLYGQEDSFRFDLGRLYRFEVRFFPDYAVEKGRELTRSIELKNPAIHLVIKRDMVKTVYEGTIRKGEPALFDSYSIAFEDLRYWVNFIVGREYGRIPLIVGFTMAAIGLIMRLVFFQKKLRIAIAYEDKNPLIYIDGKSEYFRLSFQAEKDRLIDELKHYLT